MNKKVLLATLAGFVTQFLAGWLLFGMILKGVMEAWQAQMGDCGSAEPAFLPMIVAQVAFALLLSLLITRLGKEGFMPGLITGAWITLLIMIWFDGWMFASFQFMTNEMSAYDILGNTAIGALAGGVIGWVASKVS